ncbi:YgaP family membrane protein [Sphingomonas ginkgonis]|nr:DUF2892 domain-containing protein [Sphingomonas ginkgonis]
MLKNVGPEDRLVRVVVALVLAALIYLVPITGTAALLTGLVAAVLLVTGLLARCPAYKLIGVDTSIQEQPYSTTDERAGFRN